MLKCCRKVGWIEISIVPGVGRRRGEGGGGRFKTVLIFRQNGKLFQDFCLGLSDHLWRSLEVKQRLTSACAAGFRAILPREHGVMFSTRKPTRVSTPASPAVAETRIIIVTLCPLYP